MKPVLVIEAGAALDATGKVAFRFTCRCGEQGAWHSSLNDAERSAERHQRVKHREAVSA